jgi:periplasmic protein TonB
MAPQTVDSDAPPFAQPGKARDLSHANPVCIEIPITVQGSRNVPPGAASAPVPQPFVEETRTVLAFELGAVLRMSETTVAGQILILKNTRLNREAACRVVNYKARENVKGYVEIEFLEPAPGFWGIDFPAPPAGRSTPALELQKSGAPRLSAPVPALQAPQPAAKSQNNGVPLLPDLLPAESQSRTVSALEASPTSLFGWEAPAQTETAKPAAAPPAIEKAAQPVKPPSRPAEDPTSLSGLLDSLTPLGEQVLLGKNPGAASATNSSIRKTPVPVPSAMPAFPGTSVPSKPSPRKSTDFSLQVSAEMTGSESLSSPTASPSPDFERPSPVSSTESVFSSLPKKNHSSAVLGGPIFSAGESELTIAATSGSKTWLIVWAIAVVIAVGSGLGYYRFHSRVHAPVPQAVAATVPAPPPSSPHDVTAPVDTTAGTTATQPAPGEMDSLPVAAPAPSTAQSPDAEPASSPAHNVTTRTATPPAATHSVAAPPPAPAPAAPLPVQRNQTPANLKMSSPSVSSTSRAPSEDAPSISRDVPGAIPGGAANGIGGIAPSDSQPTAPPRPKTDIHEPKLISSVSPAYPEIARRQNVQGDVVVDLLVDETGKVADAKVISGPSLLREAALESLRKNKYNPATLDGKPASAHVTVTVHFKTM